MGAVNEAVAGVVANDFCGFCRKDIHGEGKRWCSPECEQRHRLTLKHQCRFLYTGFDAQPITQGHLDRLGFDTSKVSVHFDEDDELRIVAVEGSAVLTNARDGWDWITRGDQSCWEVTVDFTNDRFEVRCGGDKCEPQPQCVGDLKALIARVSRKRPGVVA